MKSPVLPKENLSSIQKKINSNFINDSQVIRKIEQILIKKRGYVFRMPKPGESVIALMSGGLDTTVVIAMLLQHYQLHVYPLVINRGIPHTHRTKQSIQFFQHYFKNKYPHLFHDVFEIRQSIPPREVKKPLLRAENDILYYQNRKGIPLQPSLYAHYALYYAKFLEETIGVRTRTLIGAWLPSNSEWYGYESITSLRAVMLNLCINDNDYSWQFTGLPMEKDLGFYFDKDTLIKIGHDLHIPLEATWTCYKGARIHCGACPPCSVRQEGFQKAGVKDFTRYGDGLTMIQRTKKLLKKLAITIIDKLILPRE
jgi:7-cyano-7-deazaguanine synthase in queuosine biosynthesis